MQDSLRIYSTFTFSGSIDLVGLKTDWKSYIAGYSGGTGWLPGIYPGYFADRHYIPLAFRYSLYLPIGYLELIPAKNDPYRVNIRMISTVLLQISWTFYLTF